MTFKKADNNCYHSSALKRYILSTGCLILAVLIINGYIGMYAVKQSRQLHENDLIKAGLTLKLVDSTHLAYFYFKSQVRYLNDTFIKLASEEDIDELKNGFFSKEEKVQKHLTISRDFAKKLGLEYDFLDQLLHDHVIYGEKYINAVAVYKDKTDDESSELYEYAKLFEIEIENDIKAAVEKYNNMTARLIEALRDNASRHYNYLETFSIGTSVIAVLFVFIIIFILLARRISSP